MQPWRWWERAVMRLLPIVTRFVAALQLDRRVHRASRQRHGCSDSPIKSGRLLRFARGGGRVWRSSLCRHCGPWIQVTPRSPQNDEAIHGNTCRADSPVDCFASLAMTEGHGARRSAVIVGRGYKPPRGARRAMKQSTAYTPWADSLVDCFASLQCGYSQTVTRFTAARRLDRRVQLG